MKTLIIEDEAVAADRLEKMLHDLDPSIEVLAKIGSVKESVIWLQRHSADLIFLDIQLSDGLSFSIFDHIAPTTPTIFTTAYDQYAIKAFDLCSVAYLLKPIRETDLQQGLRKYQSMKTGFGIDLEGLLSTLGHGAQKHRERFLVRIGEHFKKVEVDDIAYFFVRDKDVYAKSHEKQNLSHGPLTGRT